MKILILDNFDSFTYNLYQIVGAIMPAETTIDVIRNNKTTVDALATKAYDRIIISPGPGTPTDPHYFGVCADVITTLGPTTPILGICLGMQGIASRFGGHVIRADLPMHGKTSTVSHDGRGVFAHLPEHIQVMRYHSLIVDPSTLPPELIVTATATDTGEIMGLRHATLPIEGIQFHPESFATEYGKQLLKQFLRRRHAHARKTT